MTHVVCVGDLMVDVLAKLARPLSIGSDTPAPIGIYGGGAAANVAAWLVADGAAATFVGRIGDDVLGLRAVEELSAAGVTPVVTIDVALPTGTCIVLVDHHGERTMIPSTGANAGSSDVAMLPAAADWLYVSGYALLADAARPFALEAMEVARGRGWTIAVDAASAAPLYAAGADAFLDWIGGDLLLFANTDEAQVLTGSEDAEPAARALAARCGQAIVKRGASGAVWADGTGTRSVPATPTTMVDSTGAGDAFAAGYLSHDGDVAARLGNAARLAARAVGQLGARPGSRDQRRGTSVSASS